MIGCCYRICCSQGTSGSALVPEHRGMGNRERYYSFSVASGKLCVAKCCSQEVKKHTTPFNSDVPINLVPPILHCNKNITIIKHLCQPKSIPKTFVPVGRPAANKALNLRETFLQLLIKYNTAKFHLQHIILIMGMEIIHSIAIQKKLRKIGY